MPLNTASKQGVPKDLMALPVLVPLDYHIFESCVVVDSGQMKSSGKWCKFPRYLHKNSFADGIQKLIARYQKCIA
ncbi:hypothetical protein AVEN_65204-1 [Araneus ventricosus]|uniref:Uncharacterized protein n=1 Tax=Araneus ventricosus TaxID=182803 RepID=A0A4Y2AG91_ARAVE|nr:hypothetical protein AVEN_65204-1 [Araneus ventricosus]